MRLGVVRVVVADVASMCHQGPITGLAVDAMNAVLVSASTDGTVRLWNFETHVLSTTVDVGSPITMLEICKDSGTNRYNHRLLCISGGASACLQCLVTLYCARSDRAGV